MTTAPITDADVLDFEITDPGTIRPRPPRLRVVKQVCASCQPTGSARAVLSGDEVYATCIMCASDPEPATEPETSAL